MSKMSEYRELIKQLDVGGIQSMREHCVYRNNDARLYYDAVEDTFVLTAGEREHVKLPGYKMPEIIKAIKDFMGD